MSTELRRTLTLSTVHVPSSNEEFASECIEVSKYECGWWASLSVEGLINGGIDDIPDWFRPAVEYAIKNDCSIINFDRDGPLYEELPSWEW